MTGRALVTGGGARLGRAMALWLGQRGLDVAVHFNGSEDGARETSDALRRMGRAAGAVQADLLDEDATADLVPRAADALGGPLTLLVNNASIFEEDTLADATMRGWHRHMGSNLRAPFQLTQVFAGQAPGPTVNETGEPVAAALVVNMVDQRVRAPTPDHMTYTLAKMGLWDFTRIAAQALAPRVRVNAIGPGPTLRAAGQSVDRFALQRAGTLLKRGADPADITAALAYFMDAPAVTGQLLCVDGGEHLGWR